MDFGAVQLGLFFPVAVAVGELGDVCDDVLEVVSELFSAFEEKVLKLFDALDVPAEGWQDIEEVYEFLFLFEFADEIEDVASIMVV